MKLIIPGRLPGLNEYIAAERANRHKAASLKRSIELRLILLAKAKLHAVQEPVIMRYLWVEKDRKRDLDNIAFAKKFIQDALVKAGILQNDGWRNIAEFTDSFAVDAKNPRIEVKIEKFCAKDEADN